MNHNDYVSIDHILAEVTQTLNDVEFRNGFSKGWYVSRIQDALQELAFDSFFQVITRDFDFPSGTLAMDLPKNCFNIREIYGWNGGCCSPQTSAPIYIKRLYNNKGGNGRGYTAQIKGSGGTIGTDPYNPSYYNDPTFSGYPSGLYYCNIQDGRLMFSSSCAAFPKIRLVYNGMGGEIGDLPIIPRFFERAINDYVEERYFAAMKSRDRRAHAVNWQEAYQKLTAFGGNWQKAIRRVAKMDSKAKADYDKYLAAFQIK